MAEVETARHAAVFEETELLQFRDGGNSPNLHLAYWTRGQPEKKENANLLFWNHGIGDHSGRYKSLAQRLLHSVPALDAVVTYDMRGHGQSGGARGANAGLDQLIDDCAVHVLPRMALRYGVGARVVLGGHSLGGLVVAGLASRPDMLLEQACGEVVGVVLSAPAIEVAVRGAMNSVLASIAGPLSMVPGVRGVIKANGIDTALLSSNEVSNRAYVNDPLVHDRMTLGLGADMLSTGRRLIGQLKSDRLLDCAFLKDGMRTLALQSEGDQVVEASGTKALVEALQTHGADKARYVEVKGAKHEMMMETSEHGGDEFFNSVSMFLSEVMDSGSGGDVVDQ